MKNFLDEYTIAIISLLVGLGSSGIFSDHPEIGKWLGYASLIFLIFIILRYLIVRLSNKLVPRRYANLIFMIDEENNLAMIYHPLYKRIQPAGSRLYYNERPDYSIHRVIKKELGLPENGYKLVSDDKSLERYGKSYLVPRPFQIQVEVGRHKFGVQEHYDFVYVCFANGIKPVLNSELTPIWLSLNELERISKEDIKKAPWESIIPTYRKIIDSRIELQYNEIKEINH